MQQPDSPYIAASFTHSASATPIGLRVYGQRASGSRQPLVVYFHGGLFNCGKVEDAAAIATKLADSAVVVCVDYPLAPQLHFPGTVEVAYAALHWASDNAASLGGDACKLILAGDQAGGNLAAAAAMMARDRGASTGCSGKLRGQVLINPLLDPEQSTDSMRAASECPCRQAWSDYLPTASDAMHPYASPLSSRRLGGLASALVITADGDPLRDEAEQYAARLITAGVPVQVRRMAGKGGRLVDPGYAHFAEVVQTVNQFVQDAS